MGTSVWSVWQLLQCVPLTYAFFVFFCLLFTVKHKRFGKVHADTTEGLKPEGGRNFFISGRLSPSSQNRRSDERTDKIRGKLQELQKITESVNKVSVFVIIFHSIGKVIDGVRTHTCCLLGEERHRIAGSKTLKKQRRVIQLCDRMCGLLFQKISERNFL